MTYKWLDLTVSITDETRARRLYTHAYNILVLYAGAHASQRDDFIQAFTDPTRNVTEWRFGGDLGSGGKLYREGTLLRVGYYPEDESPHRRAVTFRTNRELRFLVEEAEGVR